jgi:hypothetical protein
MSALPRRVADPLDWGGFALECPACHSVVVSYADPLDPEAVDAAVQAALALTEHALRCEGAA